MIPTYSHGGPSEPGWTAVAGTATGAGNPIEVTGAVEPCAMFVYVSGGNAVVGIEASGDAIDSTGHPPSGSWVDQSSDGAGFAITPTAPIYKTIPALKAPYWRTRIRSIDGGAIVVSGIGPVLIHQADGTTLYTRAKHPSIPKYGTEGQ